ncbi:MAG: Holliday junction resolvase Hjc [Candidatus Diapherotrites archaeon]|nr:Holliday junction resolvase Hjc [Candidatus Diapherotrites archaeon]
MTHYRKGANAERELVHILFDRGFSVIRTAGSGKTALPAPDMSAMRPGKHIAFECKAWGAGNLAIPIASMLEFVGWCDRAGVDAIVGWKVPRQGWLFLTPQDFHRTAKFFLISKKEAFEKGLSLGQLTGK